MPAAAIWRWIGPAAALLVFGGVAWVLHRELAHLHLRDIFRAAARRSARGDRHGARAHRRELLLAELLRLAGAALSAQVASPTRACVFTSFIAYAFGHNLGLAAFTGAAIRLRLYASAGLTAVDVVTVAGLLQPDERARPAHARRAFASCCEPERAAIRPHLPSWWTRVVGVALLGAVAAYVVLQPLRSQARSSFAAGSCAFRGRRISFPQVALGLVDLGIATAVLWVLLPDEANVTFLAFRRAPTPPPLRPASISHVPGGIGVFETVIILAMPQVPASELLGSMLAYRAIYYLVPLVVAARAVRLRRSCEARRALDRASARAGFALHRARRAAGRRHAHFRRRRAAADLRRHAGLDARLAALLACACRSRSWSSRTSPAASSGSRCIVLARALFRRVQAAYHISFWLLVRGHRGLAAEGPRFRGSHPARPRARGCSRSGRRAFYRPTSILEERFTPVVGREHRRRDRGGHLDRAARVPPRRVLAASCGGRSRSMRMRRARLRAMLVVVLLATAYLLLNLLQPAQPEPAVADRRRSRARAQDHRALGSHARERRAHRRQAPAVQRQRRCIRDVPGDRPKLDRAGRSGRPARASGRAGVAIPRAVRSSRRPHGVLSGERRTPAALRRPRPRRAQDRRRSARAARRISRWTARRARICGRRIGAPRAAARRFEIVPPEQVPAMLPELEAHLGRVACGQVHRGEALLRRRVLGELPAQLSRRARAQRRHAFRVREPLAHRARRTSFPSTSCASAPTRRAARWTICSSS